MDSVFNVNAPAFVPRQDDHLIEKEANHRSETSESSVPKGPKQKTTRSNNKKKQQQRQSQTHETNNNNNNNHNKSKNSKKQKPARPNLQQRAFKNNNNNNLLEEYHDDFESSVDTSSRRGKVSISHLLDFHLPSRPNQPSSSSSSSSANRSRRYSSNNGSGNNGNNAKYGGLAPPDSATYIQTTCRFLLDPEFQHEYGILLSDPDEPVPLDRVLRVLARAGSCPICLDDAKAPRMLKCGHIMCFPCFLRFMDTNPSTKGGSAAATATTTTSSGSSGSNGIVGSRTFSQAQPAPVQKHKECPLCFERIVVNQIMPVTFLDFDEKFDTPRPNTESVLRLMFRPHTDIYSNAGNDSKANESGDDIGGEATFMNAVPVTSPDLSPSLFNRVPTVSPTSLVYSRLILPTKQYLVDQFERELADLKVAHDEEKIMYGENGFEDVAQYYRQAMGNIKKTMHGVLDSASFEKTEEATRASGQQENGNGNNQQADPITSSEQYLDMYNETCAYYFYQTAPESQVRYFLSPFDVKILLHEYGGYKSFPTSLVVAVQNVVHGHYMSPELRKRFRYLSHIPDYTEVAFIECDWVKTREKSEKKEMEKEKEKEGKREKLRPVISAETITHFEKELQARTQQLAKKAKWEKNQAKKYQQMEDMKMRDIIWAEYSGPNSSSWGIDHFGSFGSGSGNDNGMAFPSLEETKNQIEQQEKEKEKLRQQAKKGNTTDISLSDTSLPPNNNSSGTAPSTSSSSSHDNGKPGIAIFATPKKKTVWGTSVVIHEKQLEEEQKRARQEAINSGWVDFYNLDLGKQSKDTSSNNSGNGDNIDIQNTNNSTSNKQETTGKKKKTKPKKIVLMSTGNLHM